MSESGGFDLGGMMGGMGGAAGKGEKKKPRIDDNLPYRSNPYENIDKPSANEGSTRSAAGSSQDSSGMLNSSMALAEAIKRQREKRKEDSDDEPREDKEVRYQGGGMSGKAGYL